MSGAPTPEVYTPDSQHRAILEALLAHGGWMMTSQVAEAAEVARDTARRFLRDDAREGWVERQTFETGEERWRIGPVLPRLGLAYLRLLEREQSAIRERFDAATVPHDWQVGANGQSQWRPEVPRG